MHLKAIIFDWAGTTVDFGSLCPIAAFQSAFSTRGVNVKAEHIHRFMGMRKREHVQSVLSVPEVTRDWEITNKRAPISSDVDEIYKLAEEIIMDTVTKFAAPTPFVQDAMATARSLGLKIGSTTGYTAPMMEKLAPAARRKGYAPDAWVGSDQVPQGRPWPWMIFKNMEMLNVCPPSSVVKVGDTLADVAEGINAGVWTVCVLESSSMIGKSERELLSTPQRSLEVMYRKVRKQYAEAGAHFVIKNLSELEGVLERIESRLDKGMMPPRIKRRASRLSLNILL